MAGRAILAAGVIVGGMLPAAADVRLPAIFSDHAVLQKTNAVPIWGTADPDEKVTVTLDSTKAEVTATADGKWKTSLDLSAKGAGPFMLTVEGKNKLAVNDVLVGEVWVCSGQSNMEFTLNKEIDSATEIPRSDNTLLRQFLVTKKSVTTPTDDLEGQWTIAGPKTSGLYTAVGYYFGKKLQQQLKAPVGLINTSWGGSVIEAWMSKDTLDKNPELKDKTAQMLSDIDTLDQRMKDFQAKYGEWSTKYGRQDKPVGTAADYAAEAVDTSAWKTVKMPGMLAELGLPDAGVVWVRRVVQIPTPTAGHTLPLDLGTINQFETVYWNDQKIGETNTLAPGSLSPRRYMVPGPLVKGGDNVVAIRIFSPAGEAGIKADAALLRVGTTIAIDGDWQAKVESELPPLSAAAKSEYPVMPTKLVEAQFRPSCLFNGMIHPLLPYAIKGVIWYQGEANATRAFQYRTSFPAMIANWRAVWGQGDFPFYWCQLANFTTKKAVIDTDLSSWAELREAQTMTLALPHTGEAVLIDLGEEGDIHPRDKHDPGDRLARVALAQSYDRKDCVFSGPVYKSFTIEGDKVRVRFEPAASGLVARELPATYHPKSSLPATLPLVRNSPGSELEGFVICGEDKAWKWAQAKIDNDSVIVWSPDVPKPIAVRYAWTNDPTCNLYNAAGLPAGPFRTDQFPGKTDNEKF